MGVSKELFCRLPQMRERVHLEIEKKRTDRILPQHARIHEPISLHGLRPSFFAFFPYPILASRLCQIGLLIWWIRPNHRSGVPERNASPTGLNKAASKPPDSLRRPGDPKR